MIVCQRKLPVKKPKLGASPTVIVKLTCRPSVLAQAAPLTALEPIARFAIPVKLAHFPRRGSRNVSWSNVAPPPAAIARVRRYSHRPMQRVLIAGCGDVGTRLGLALAADGEEVIGLRRCPEALPASILRARGDLRSGEGLVPAARGVNVLVYTAAADGFGDEAYRDAYVVGLANVLAALRDARAPLERVLFTSSTAVYAQDDGGWVDETSPAEPAGFSGRRLLEAESLALAAGVAATVLRLAGIYGPGRTRLIEDVRSGHATVPDQGAPTWTNRIHADDCAGAARHLLRLPAERAHGVWLGVDHEPCDRGLVLDWLAGRLDAARPRRVSARAAPARARGTSKRCSSAKLREAGYAFRFPTFREGYADVLAHLAAPA